MGSYVWSSNDIEDFHTAEEIDTRIRNAVQVAENEYDDPAIVVILHPSIHTAITYSMNPDTFRKIDDVTVNGYPTVVNEHVSAAVAVCGEGYERNDILDRNNI